MIDLISQVKKLKKTDVSLLVNKQLTLFTKTNTRCTKTWFSELCFCILTANSKALTAINIQEEIGKQGFLDYSQEKISNIIKNNGHRFHNNKAKFIVLAREHKNIKHIIKNEKDPRAWLVENIKGIAWKESSHFLRNVGYFDYAILDRHILNLLVDEGYLKTKPKTLNKKLYFEIENIFRNLAKKLDMSCAELDFYMWYIKTGTVLK